MKFSSLLLGLMGPADLPPHLPPPPGTEAVGDGGGHKTRAQLKVVWAEAKGEHRGQCKHWLEFQQLQVKLGNKRGKN